MREGPRLPLTSLRPSGESHTLSYTKGSGKKHEWTHFSAVFTRRLHSDQGHIRLLSQGPLTDLQICFYSILHHFATNCLACLKAVSFSMEYLNILKFERKSIGFAKIEIVLLVNSKTPSLKL